MKRGAHEKTRRDRLAEKAQKLEQPEQPRPARSYRTAILLASTLLALLLMLLAAGFLYLRSILKAPQGRQDTAAKPAQNQTAEGEEPIRVGDADRKENVFTLLVLGLDKSEKLSDTIIAATFDMDNKTAAVLNIPRDTLSSYNGGSIHKLNSAYGSGGIERTIAEVQNLIGYEIDRHMVVTCDAFISLIDAIGGVDYEIPKDMYKVTDDMVIDLKAGQQHLDGEHALMFMRYRGYANADLSRIKAQQGFYKAVFAKLAQPSNVFKLPTLVSKMLDKVETDLTLGEMLWIGMNFYSMDADDLVLNTLPNTPQYIGGASYVIPLEREILALVNAYYNPYTTPITALALTPVPEDAEIGQAEPAQDEEPDARPDEEDPYEDDPYAEDPYEEDPDTDTSESDEESGGFLFYPRRPFF